MFSTLKYLSPIVTMIVNQAMLPNAKSTIFWVKMNIIEVQSENLLW